MNVPTWAQTPWLHVFRYWGQKFCLGASYVLMLGINGLILHGSWAQNMINWDSSSVVMEMSMG